MFLVKEYDIRLIFINDSHLILRKDLIIYSKDYVIEKKKYVTLKCDEYCT